MPRSTMSEPTDQVMTAKGVQAIYADDSHDYREKFRFSNGYVMMRGCEWVKNDPPPIPPKPGKNPNRPHTMSEAAYTFGLMPLEELEGLLTGPLLELYLSRYMSIAVIGAEIIITVRKDRSDQASSFFRVMLNAGARAMHENRSGNYFYNQLENMAGMPGLVKELERNQMQFSSCYGEDGNPIRGKKLKDIIESPLSADHISRIRCYFQCRILPLIRAGFDDSCGFYNYALKKGCHYVPDGYSVVKHNPRKSAVDSSSALADTRQRKRKVCDFYVFMSCIF